MLFVLMQYDLYNEISILERTQPHAVTQLLDYGLANDQFIMVQKAYKTSLSAWRQRQGPDLGRPLRTYLMIFDYVVSAVKVSLNTSQEKLQRANEKQIKIIKKS